MQFYKGNDETDPGRSSDQDDYAIFDCEGRRTIKKRAELKINPSKSTSFKMDILKKTTHL